MPDDDSAATGDASPIRPFVNEATPIGTLIRARDVCEGGWLFTAPMPAMPFMRRLFAAGLFVLPDMVDESPVILLANPEQRYCIDLELTAVRDVKWKGSKMQTSALRQFRLTMDKDFRGSLRRLIEHHRKRAGTTWFNDELYARICRMHEECGADDDNSGGGVMHHVFELWDAATGDLLAVTAGFGVGSAYHVRIATPCDAILCCA
jgi:Leu/Phe-tRNA-protein transferase